MSSLGKRQAACLSLKRSQYPEIMVQHLWTPSSPSGSNHAAHIAASTRAGINARRERKATEGRILVDGRELVKVGWCSAKRRFQW
jgi:hypothetical protein